MKSFLLVLLILISFQDVAFGACRYSVKNIRTLLNVLAREGEFTGPKNTIERDGSGTITRSYTGSYIVNRTGLNDWTLAGDFCTPESCESSEINLSIRFGCLYSGSRELEVIRASLRELYYVQRGLGPEYGVVRLERTSSPIALTVDEGIFSGPRWLFLSRFLGI